MGKSTMQFWGSSWFWSEAKVSLDDIAELMNVYIICIYIYVCVCVFLYIMYVLIQWMSRDKGRSFTLLPYLRVPMLCGSDHPISSCRMCRVVQPPFCRFLASELVPYVDRNFRTSATKGSRALIGHWVGKCWSCLVLWDRGLWDVGMADEDRWR